MFDLVPLARSGRAMADTDRASLSASCCSSHFHTFDLELLLPSAPAVMNISRASGYRFEPTCFHHASMDVTVELLVPVWMLRALYGLVPRRLPHRTQLRLLRRPPTGDALVRPWSPSAGGTSVSTARAAHVFFDHRKRCSL